MSRVAFWPTTRCRRWALLLILLLGTVLRVWLWLRTPIHQPANDEVEYLAVARDLLAGRGWQFYNTYHWLRAPLYPLYLAGVLWLADGTLRWAALPTIGLSVLNVYLLYLLGREVGSSGFPRAHPPDRSQLIAAERVGLITAMGAALLLTLATFASLWMAETLFTTLFLLGVLLLIRCAAYPRVWLALVTGAVWGLAILTRSQPLLALPFAIIWLVVVIQHQQGRRGGVRMGMACGATIALACALTIAPWTIRNYLAYDALITVETGLSYNLWQFNEPREDTETIFRILEQIPNPADRAAYGTERGLERLREDPAILLRKLWPNFNALWRVDPVEDRFLQTSYVQDVPITIFATSLLLDDALYMLLAVLGVSCLFHSPFDRWKVLLGGWLLYINITVLLTHGEGRYRHFLFPVLLPYAAWLIVRLMHAPLRRTLPIRRVALVGAITVALLWSPLLVEYPTEYAGRNLRRGWAVQRAEWAAGRGDHSRSIALYQGAAAIDPQSVDVQLALGMQYQQLGQIEAALTAYQAAFSRAPMYIPANVRRGDALRTLGQIEAAREAFRGFYTDEVQMLDWAWQHLAAEPPSTIAIGDGLDFGYVGRMYAAEDQLGRRARWTTAQAELRLLGSADRSAITLDLAAPRPDDHGVPVQVCVNDQCQTFDVAGQWRSYTVVVPPAPTYHVVLTTPVFRPQTIDPASPDTRTLGVLIDQASSTSLIASN